METKTDKKQVRPTGFDRSGQIMVEFWPYAPATETACPECGAPAISGRGCRELYEELLELETWDPAGAGSVHNLSVLCYMLQHPAGYSAAALNWAIASLKGFLANRDCQDETDPKSRKLFRPHSFRAAGFLRSLLGRKPKSESASQPAMPARWQLTIDQVFQTNPQGHPERVRVWARTILSDLGHG